MRLIKMLGLAAMTALAAMAFVGASTASATESTVLCLEKTTNLVCPAMSQVSHEEVHMILKEGTVGKLLSSLATVLCLEVLAKGLALLLAEAPEKLEIHGELFLADNCGTNSTHTNCTITEEEPSLFLLLNENKEEEGEVTEEKGTLEAMGGITHVVCTEVGIFKVKVDCKYAANGLEFTVSEQHLTANETPVNIIEGSFFCPSESKLDGLLETLVNVYVRG